MKRRLKKKFYTGLLLGITITLLVALSIAGLYHTLGPFAGPSVKELISIVWTIVKIIVGHENA